jgi:glycosyltransferase involved in cell wall biosynthesis
MKSDYSSRQSNFVDNESASLQSWPSNIRVVIPSYKSSAMLKNFLPQLIAKVPLKQITIIDDASNDSTQSVCRNFGIRCLSHKENSGKGAALITGFADSLKHNAEWIITMDSDGQHSPADIDNFIQYQSNHPNQGMIIGARAMQPGCMPIGRICSNRLTSFVLSVLTGLKILDSQCGYRMYSAKLVSSVSIAYKRFEMESEIILKAAYAKFPISFINIQTLYCSEQSHISHIADTFRWIKAVIRVWVQLRSKKGLQKPAA